MLYDRKSDTNMWLKTACEGSKWKLYSRYLGFFPQGSSLLHFFYIKSSFIKNGKELYQDKQNLSISEYMYKVHYNFESLYFHIMHLKILT